MFTVNIGPNPQSGVKVDKDTFDTLMVAGIIIAILVVVAVVIFAVLQYYNNSKYHPTANIGSIPTNPGSNSTAVSTQSMMLKSALKSKKPTVKSVTIFDPAIIGKSDARDKFNHTASLVTFGQDRRFMPISMTAIDMTTAAPGSNRAIIAAKSETDQMYYGVIWIEETNSGSVITGGTFDAATFVEPSKITHYLKPSPSYFINTAIKWHNKVWLARDILIVPNWFWMAEHDKDKFAVMCPNEVVQVNFYPRLFRNDSNLTGVYSPVKITTDEAHQLYQNGDARVYFHLPGANLTPPRWSRYFVVYLKL